MSSNSSASSSGGKFIMFPSQLLRVLPPVLAATLLFLVRIELVPAPPDSIGWKAVGLLLPALWLASVCPERLIRKGGSLMRIFRVKSSRQNVALFGLIWFLVFLVTAFFLHSEILKSLFIKRLLYCISYGGLMSALGVFAFLALHPEGANATEKLNADGGDKKPR